jgi:hypothetical protein
MTPQELEAYGKIAFAISLLVHGAQETKPGTKIMRSGQEIELQPPYFYHCSMSLWEAAAVQLWKLQILEPLDEEHRWAYHFKFTCELSDVSSLARSNAGNGPSIEDLLKLFMELRAEFTGSFFKNRNLFSVNGRTIFGIRPEEIPTFEDLKRLGFVEATSTGYTPTAALERLMSGTGWLNE